MAITAAMVKELRESTGAGMMECKKALTETNGDMDAAVEYLRKNGIMKAEKKASRIAAEGLTRIAVKDDQTAAVVEVNSETDFVAKNDTFKEYVDLVAKQALASNASDLDAFMNESWNADTSKTVKEALTDKIAVIGENLKIRRFEKVEAADGFVVSYIHGGGRIAVLLSIEGEENDATKEAAMNVAMQIAAMSPKYISQADVDQDYLKSEEDIIREQIANDPAEASKPDKVKEGMIKGRMSKLMKDVCLLDQVYVKAEDGKQSVSKYLQSVGDITVEKFVRFETGEGLEKKEENFAEEVAKQMGA